MQIHNGGLMNEQKIRSLIKIVEESNIEELEISQWGKKIRICKTTNHAPVNSVMVAPPLAETAARIPETAPTLPASASTDESGKTQNSDGFIEIKSPMVGTFYRRPAPDAEPYVEIGDTISPGKVLCIIEAMKLMNEIEAEMNGKIVEILTENAQPVEYNQPLFRVQKL